MPTITVTPSTGLEPLDSLLVRGTDWIYGVPVQAGQCPAGAADFGACSPDFIGFAYPGQEQGRVPERLPLPRTRAQLEAGQSFVIDMPALVEIFAGHPGGFVNCRREPCEMLVTDAADLRQDRVALEFVPGSRPGTSGGPVAAVPAFTG